MQLSNKFSQANKNQNAKQLMSRKTHQQLTTVKFQNKQPEN